MLKEFGADMKNDRKSAELLGSSGHSRNIPSFQAVELLKFANFMRYSEINDISPSIRYSMSVAPRQQPMCNEC